VLHPTLLRSWDIALETALIPWESTMLRVWIGLPEVILTQRAGAGTTGRKVAVPGYLQ